MNPVVLLGTAGGFVAICYGASLANVIIASVFTTCIAFLLFDSFDDHGGDEF